ncbi:hypothetical protein MAR_009048 [Mya arenaria]|uniref:Uncharacterized protein n=1 Tax=Mya arenaria TaxID=6604 RepID=A0ABY7DYB1_MYAAR|nr:hypothetical protein MAR_009048 [Mya arenaria]
MIKYLTFLTVIFGVEPFDIEGKENIAAGINVGANVTVVSVRSSHGYNPPRNGYNQYPTPPIRGKAACQNVPSSPNNEPTTYNKLRSQANAIGEVELPKEYSHHTKVFGDQEICSGSDKYCAEGANVAVVGVHSTSSYYPPQNGYNQYPPPLTYNQAGSQYPPPPAYNQADSQYPPPPAYNQAGSQYPPPPAYNQFAALNAPSSQPPAFGQATPGFSQTAYPPPPSFNSVPTNNHEK